MCSINVTNNINAATHQVPSVTAKLKPVVLGSLLALSSALVGCGSSESSAPESVDEATQPVAQTPDEGTLILALTDAEEDFVSYTVDVESITLTRANGDQVSVLSEATQVDFVEYQELTELFSVLKVPAGTYDSIEMAIDYTNATILIQDDDAVTYEAQAVDENEVPLTVHTVAFQLSDSEELEINKNQISQLTLDFDLSASNTILSFEPALVQVEPFVIGEANLDEDREHRVRGTINSVDTDAQTVTLNLRPMSKKQGQFGEYTTHFTADTSIEVDGETLDLTSALTNFSTQGEDYPLAIWGTVTVDEVSDETQFIAEEVLAGTSVPWSGKDVFKGMISDLEDGVTYVSGLTIDTDESSRAHIQDYGFTVSDETSFVSHTETALDASYLVPGQKIQAFGQLTVTDETSSFDASAETVRILTSKVFGQVMSIDENDIATIEVKRINKRPVKVLKRLHRSKKRNQNSDVTDSEETSTEETSTEETSSEETAETFIVDLSALTQVEVADSDWINVVGYLTPDSILEDEVDMNAMLVTKYAVSESELTYTALWGREGTTPTIDDTFSSMTVALDTGSHRMNVRFNPENIMPELTGLTLVAADESNRFAIRQKGEETVFFDTYSELLTGMAAKLADEDTVSAYAVKGTVDADTEEFAVKEMVVKFN